MNSTEAYEILMDSITDYNYRKMQKARNMVKRLKGLGRKHEYSCFCWCTMCLDYSENVSYLLGIHYD